MAASACLFATTFLSSFKEVNPAPTAPEETKITSRFFSFFNRTLIALMIMIKCDVFLYEIIKLFY